MTPCPMCGTMLTDEMVDDEQAPKPEGGGAKQVNLNEMGQPYIVGKEPRAGHVKLRVRSVDQAKAYLRHVAFNLLQDPRMLEDLDLYDAALAKARRDALNEAADLHEDHFGQPRGVSTFSNLLRARVAEVK